MIGFGKTGREWIEELPFDYRVRIKSIVSDDMKERDYDCLTIFLLRLISSSCSVEDRIFLVLTYSSWTIVNGFIDYSDISRRAKEIAKEYEDVESVEKVKSSSDVSAKKMSMLWAGAIPKSSPLNSVPQGRSPKSENTEKQVFNPQPHYDNSKGSLYKVSNERGWNSYLFDIVKRLERSGKKGEFVSDLEKSIDVILLWAFEEGVELKHSVTEGSSLRDDVLGFISALERGDCTEKECISLIKERVK